ncbi:MAG: hypothetical protein JXJ20_00100 [Anaerolineae bacterium]|nr:hypothetical protein [Anaerolineae bacterium]
MGSKYKLVVVCGVLGIMMLAGRALAFQPLIPATTPSASSFVSPGHWEIVSRTEYYNIPEENLKGDIGPAYLLYLVSLAGFHTDTFGIAVGPDDDVRFTTDGGQSWTKAASELHCRHGLEIVDERVAWHCGNGGTRLSTNGGQSWQTVAPSRCPFLSFLDAQTGWSASPSSLQATTDGGTSWNAISLPPGTQRIAAIALRTADDGYVLDTTGALFVTTTGGLSWEVHSLGLKAGEQLIAGAASGPYAVMRFLDAQNGMVVFALPDRDRTVWFAITRDGGQSWQRAEILELLDQSYYYHLFLSRDGRLLTATDSFLNGENISILLRYQEP